MDILPISHRFHNLYGAMPPISHRVHDLFGAMFTIIYQLITFSLIAAQSVRDAILIPFNRLIALCRSAVRYIKANPVWISQVVFGVACVALFCGSLYNLWGSDAYLLFYNQAFLKSDFFNDFEEFRNCGIVFVALLWFVFNLNINVLQKLDDIALKKDGIYAHFKVGLAFTIVRAICASNSFVLCVAIDFMFKTDSDLRTLYYLLASFLFLNLSKLRFDDWYTMDTIIGSIIGIHGNRAYNHFNPVVCCKDEAGGEFKIAATFGICYLLCSRIVLYYCVDFKMRSTRARDDQAIGVRGRCKV